MDKPARASLFKRFLRHLWPALLLLVPAAWGVGALGYCGLPSFWGAALAVVFAAAVAACCIRWSGWRALAAGGALCIIVWGCWLAVPARNDRDWQPDVAVTAWAEIQGAAVTVHNIRNCDYRTETDYTVRHYDRTFRLSELNSLDYMLVDWGLGAVAHTMVSFGFADGSYLCASVETRKEKGESYSTIAGFFHNYELFYVLADERDLIRLRTNIRKGENVRLYRLRLPADQRQEIFMSYLKRANELHAHPSWYNALTNNCMTEAFMRNARHQRATWKIVLNGYSDELFYERGGLDRSLPFAELKRRSLINEKARAADQAPDFSRRIREGLPGIGGEKQ